MATGGGSAADFSSLCEVAADYPLVKGYKAAFGTAGFRGPAENLKGVAFRSGVVIALRCYAAKGDCGLIVTASHNQVDDNGFKFVDYNGEIFPPIWEDHAEKIVNAESPDDLVSICQAICKEEGIELVQRAEEPFQVFAGHDTRPSSPNLLEIAIKGIKSLKVEIAFEAGLQTTPQVYYRVWRRHRKIACGEFQWLKYLSGGYMRLVRGTHGKHGVLTVDCSNGIAAPKLERLGNCPGSVPLGYKFNLLNTGDGTLNLKCGADYVQRTSSFPINFESIDELQRCVSVDGDADRAVYFTKVNGKPVVLDGDKIAALVALHVSSLLDMNTEYKNTYSLGVVLTGYSNRALVDYLKSSGIEVTIAQTGVKYLYRAAMQYHVGIYYEANGHGSVVFSPRFSNALRESEMKEEEEPASFELLAVLDIMNQTVGDGISNILLVEAILRIREWSIEDWMKLYQPYPSAHATIAVNNKSALVTNETDMLCVEPKDLQSKIDDMLKQYSHSRAFVRPSGTEDIVRIYAEGASQTDVDQIIEKLSKIVRDSLER